MAARRSGPLGPELVPLGANVAVIPAEKEKITPGGIHLPDTAKRRTIKGKVFAIGPDVKSITCGDMVFLPDHGGTRFELGNEVFLIYPEEDILAREKQR